MSDKIPKYVKDRIELLIKPFCILSYHFTDKELDEFGLNEDEKLSLFASNDLEEIQKSRYPWLWGKLKKVKR